MVCATQVRASNLQELVYKLGQAGVTKATVTITFDNTDKEQSPLGYRDYDQITITRQVILRYFTQVSTNSVRLRVVVVASTC